MSEGDVTQGGDNGGVTEGGSNKAVTEGGGSGDVTAGGDNENVTEGGNNDVTQTSDKHWSASLPEAEREAFAGKSLDEVKALMEGPKSPEKFDVPEGFKEEDLSSFSETAKELGFSQEQFKKVLEFDQKRQTEANEAEEKSYNDELKVAKDKMRSELGEDGFAKNFENAKLAVTQHLNESDRNWLKSSGLANDDRMHAILGKLGAKLSEDSLGEGGPKATKPLTETQVANKRFSKSFPTAS